MLSALDISVSVQETNRKIGFKLARISACCEQAPSELMKPCCLGYVYHLLLDRFLLANCSM